MSDAAELLGGVPLEERARAARHVIGAGGTDISERMVLLAVAVWPVNPPALLPDVADAEADTYSGERSCAGCGVTFVAASIQRRYCSRPCRMHHWRRSRREKHAAVR